MRNGIPFSNSDFNPRKRGCFLCRASVFHRFIALLLHQVRLARSLKLNPVMVQNIVMEMLRERRYETDKGPLNDEDGLPGGEGREDGSVMDKLWWCSGGRQ